MAYIQQLPVQGTGPKIFPDAAMDAGTRGLIDMIDPWSWGGAVPADGAALPLNAGPLNYPMAEDGWTEDAARAGTATLVYSDSGIRFGAAAADRLQLPVGFRHRAADRHLGLILWLKNQPFPGNPAGFNNCLYASVASPAVQNISINVTYNSSGVVTAMGFRLAITTVPIGVPAALVAAIMSGNLCQVGFEFEIASDSATFTVRFYLNGAFVSQQTIVRDAAFTAPAASDYASLGRHQIFTGSGLNGHAWRAIMQQLDVSGARSMAETVALDYQLNAARIAAAAA